MRYLILLISLIFTASCSFERPIVHMVDDQVKPIEIEPCKELKSLKEISLINRLNIFSENHVRAMEIPWIHFLAIVVLSSYHIYPLSINKRCPPPV